MTTATCHGPECGVEFESKRGAKYHNDACRKAASRARGKTKVSGSTTDSAEGADHKPTAETEYGRDILAAVRVDLEKAKVLDTVDGRVALYLARKSIDPDCKNPAAMFKEMRAALAVAKAGAEPSGPQPTPTPVAVDEVAAARQRAKEQLEAAKNGKGK